MVSEKNGESPLAELQHDLEEALKKPAVPTLEEFIQKMISMFGSADAFVAEYYETMRAAKNGSMIKARMMEKLIDLMKVHHQLNHHVADGDLTQHSDAELEAVLGGVLKRMEIGQ